MKQFGRQMEKQFEVKRKQIEYISMFFEIVILWCIAHRLGMEGTGFLTVALSVYLVLWIVLAESFADSIGRMIRVRKSKGQYMSVLRVRRMAVLWQSCVGMIGTVCMLAVGTFFTEPLYHSVYSKLMIWLLAPLVLFRAMSALLIGFNQGEGTELPAVVTAVLRPVAAYGLGIVFSEVFQNYGEKISLLLKQERYTSMYAGAGWCLAMSMTELAIVLFNLLAYFGARRMKRGQETESMRSKDSFSGFLVALYGNCGNKILVRLLEMLPAVVGMTIYYYREENNVAASYGSYFVGYFSVCMALVYLMSAVTIPFWGRIASLLKKDEKRLAKVAFQGGIHLHIVLGLWLSVSFTAMAAQVGAIVGFTSPNLVKIVVPGSFWVVFMSLAFYFSRLLMRLGKGLLAVGMAAVSDILFFLVFMIFLDNSQAGLTALMYAGLITAGVYAVLLGAICIQILSVRMNYFTIFAIPIITVSIVGFLEGITAKLLINYLGNTLTVLISGGCGFFLLWTALLFLRNFKKEELSIIPYGSLIHTLGDMFGVF